MVRVVDGLQQGSVASPFVVEANSGLEAIEKIIKYLKRLEKQSRPRFVRRIEVEYVVRPLVKV